MPQHKRNNPNRVPSRHSRANITLAAMGIAVAAGAGGIWLLLEGGKGDSGIDSNTSASNTPASASQYPGESPTPKETITPKTPSYTEASKSPTVTDQPEKPRPIDNLKDAREAAAHRYGSCALTFTKGGTVSIEHGSRTQLNLDLSFLSNADSTNVRQEKPSGLVWTQPEVIVAKIDKDNKFSNPNYDAVEPRGDVNPTHTRGFFPVQPEKGTLYGVFVETSATTPYDGERIKTVDNLLCGVVEYQGVGEGWRSPDTDLISGMDTFYTKNITEN